MLYHNPLSSIMMANASLVIGYTAYSQSPICIINHEACAPNQQHKQSKCHCILSYANIYQYIYIYTVHVSYDILHDTTKISYGMIYRQILQVSQHNYHLAFKRPIYHAYPFTYKYSYIYIRNPLYMLDFNSIRDQYPTSLCHQMGCIQIICIIHLLTILKLPDRNLTMITS